MPATLIAPARQAQRLHPAGAVRDVTPDVGCLRLSIVNVYLYGDQRSGDRRWVLIDTGLQFSAGSIVRAAAERFGASSRPAAIVLTHGHFDHVGTVQELAERWDVPVYAHPLEMPYLTGESSYPPPDPAVGGGGMALLSRFYPRGPIDLGARVRPLPANGSVPGMPRWRWIHTPGHAPGHVSFFRDEDRTLIAGDAFVTTKQESAIAALMQPQFVHGPPAYFTPDWQAARRSVEALARLEPNVAATGHGVPMYGETLRRELHNLADHFDRAIPTHGRYVNHPAVTNEHGIVSVPPPVTDRNLVAIGSVALAALAGLALMKTMHGSTRRSEAHVMGFRGPRG